MEVQNGLTMAEIEPHYAQIAPGALPPIVRQPVHVVVDNVRSAFNVGSFFRTADAAAAEHMLVWHDGPPAPQKA